MKTQDLFERAGNTSIAGVLNTIVNIYQGKRTNTSPRLCHMYTASNIDPAHPADQIVLFGYGDSVVHSAVIRNGAIVHQYEGVSSSELLPSGNLQINTRGNLDELEPVYSISVGRFLKFVGDLNEL